ncbi:hypothetical protein PF005_g20655 [Phytophthora fragariae]|uniref:Uncharacterized protein n=1 Tax=Phytophthora fragariae TaxID=53985 RepID=A0A6A3RMF9_9STRA|nr:hypothetical protein PF003_g19115 [Phytophthora fragariae]KAE8939926.1 hypothetical protein PF009_g10260 [Phytophthora fragariae]KAE9099644.1 hypothetical protein PF007_g15799 [Phytophthora fragariae]KAE9137126.1 hypothetical protein PF006_g14255 [Phytophthora fragariae]KAE9186927.1 hypothetical protein PF005_g20655 [Phytophthora fragariae]
MDWKQRAMLFFRFTHWFAKRGRTEAPGSTSAKDIQVGSVIECERVGDLVAYKNIYPQGTAADIKVIEQPVHSLPAIDATTRASKKQKETK